MSDLSGRGASRLTYHGEDGHLFQPTPEDTWVCICGDEVGDHEERPSEGWGTT